MEKSIRYKMKDWVKENHDSKNIVIRIGLKSMYGIKKILYTTKQICTDSEFRALFCMKLFKSTQVHQTTPLTAMNRYPKIFSACKDYLSDKKDVKILSYGCSTGEEVVTLRSYFENANIVGADVNSHSLKICRNRNLDNKIKFIFSKPSELRKYGKYDAIFCMAVLQRTPQDVTQQGITSLKKIYPFEKFEQQIVELDGYVKKGGLLIVHFSQYSFEDTVVSQKYKSLGDYSQDDYRASIFDRNSELVEGKIDRKSVFVKLED